MLDPLDFENRPYLNALSNKRKRAFITITIENIALHSWRVFFWVLMFFGLWMLGLPEFFGKIISLITAVIFAVGIIYLFKSDVLSFKFPREKELDTALEKQSSLPKGYISVLNDRLANPEKDKTRDLWNYAQKEMLHSLLYRLKPARLRSVLSRKDPAALRLIAVLIFISGLLVSGSNWQNRIFSGIFPVSPSNIILQGGKGVNLWIKPPEYTQIEQIHITKNSVVEALNIAQGSKIRLRLHSMLGEILPPIFYNGDVKLEMDYLGDGLYGIEREIEQASSILVKQGFVTRARWDYNFIIDTPPEITIAKPKDGDGEITKPYEIMDNGVIRFNLNVKDDYGVKNLYMLMDIDEMVEERPLGSPVKQSRLIMSQPNIEFKISPIYDIAWHTWAGLPVTFEYSITDHKGQISKLEKIKLTLPEREFRHPMAKSLIAMRKRLAWDYNGSFIEISRNLEILLSAPDYFQNNISSYLAVRSASSRLFYSNKYEGEKRIEAAMNVIKTLWDVALAIEDGDLSLAMRELRSAQRDLENAMSDPNSSDKEIDALMDNLREKMAAYFAEMQREMQKNIADGKDFPMMSADDFGGIISPDAISTLMAKIESALKSGDAELAQKLMSQLQRMMEMMYPSANSQLPMDMQAMHEGINELEKLIDSQKSLLKQSLNITTPAPSKIEQEALRYVLGQLMLDVSEKLDEIPETMGQAEQEMRLSENALGENFVYKSIPHQELTIKYLKDAQEELSKQFKQRMQQMIGLSFNGQQKLDPLGRPYGKESNDVKIPDRAQKKRVDEILKILRDRSGDLNRSDEELYYLRRLLRQF